MDQSVTPRRGIISNMTFCPHDFRLVKILWEFGSQKKQSPTNQLTTSQQPGGSGSQHRIILANLGDSRGLLYRPRGWGKVSLVENLRVFCWKSLHPWRWTAGTYCNSMEVDGSDDFPFYILMGDGCRWTSRSSSRVYCIQPVFQSPRIYLTTQKIPKKTGVRFGIPTSQVFFCEAWIQVMG